MKRVFAAGEYGIRHADMDPSAVKIVNRLQSFGYQAYIVGGAVRDLLVGMHPKDFDIATDAAPNRIRKLFRNSRIIGKRFRLVHIYFRDGKIIEVSTFRSLHSEGFQNKFGTLEEDVLRRDFSANALYYNPRDNTLLDYVDGLRDVAARRLRPLIPLKHIFTEDPVRMIRAVKYSCIAGLRMPLALRRKIRHSAHLLADCPDSRVSEELFKILLSGHATEIITSCLRYGLLRSIQPGLDRQLRKRSEFTRLFFSSMNELDSEFLDFDGDYGRARALKHFLTPFIRCQSIVARQSELEGGFDALYNEARAFLQPMIPAYFDLRRALVQLAPLHRPKRRRRSGYRGRRLQANNK